MAVPKELLQTAHQFHSQGQLDKAADIYHSLLNVHPDDAGLLYLMGTLEMQKGHNGAAINFLEAALTQREFGEAYNNLGSAYKAENNNEMAAKCFTKAKELKPDDPDIYNNLSTLHINEGEPRRCIEAASKAIELEPDHPNAHWNRGLAHLELGHWKLGWEGYEWGFKSKDRMVRNYDSPKWKVPWWDGSKGKRVIVYGEQGVGDEIMFSSIIPDLVRDSEKVIFDCHPRLIRLFRRSFGIECYPTRKEEEITWLTERMDAKVAIGSLGKFYRNTPKDFPNLGRYLHPDPMMVEHFKRELETLNPGKLKVGIAWAGGKKKTRYDLRSIDLKYWSEVLSQKANFVSIQYHKEAGDEARRYGLPHWQHVIDDLDELAALMAACDLIISVNQSAVHMAGAMNVPCWCLTPDKPAWRYQLEGTKMIWYGDAIRQYRRKKDDSWAPVMTQVASDLAARIKAHG